MDDAVTVTLKREDAEELCLILEAHPSVHWLCETTVHTIAALRTALDAPAPEPGAVLLESRWRCPACGLGVRIDEDGCCIHCGADCEEVPCEVVVSALPAEGAPAPEPVGGAEAMRERCARVCDERAHRWRTQAERAVPELLIAAAHLAAGAEECAAAIRALPAAEGAPPQDRAVIDAATAASRWQDTPPTTEPRVTVRSIVTAHLTAHGYDGLWNADGECGCVLGELMPCGETCLDCRPGYRVPCDCGEHNYHVRSVRPPRPEVPR